MNKTDHILAVFSGLISFASFTVMFAVFSILSPCCHFNVTDVLEIRCGADHQPNSLATDQADFVAFGDLRQPAQLLASKVFYRSSLGSD
jgi:hypothetical protein